MAEDPIVRLDDCRSACASTAKAALISLLVVLGVRADGQEARLIKSMGGESAEATSSTMTSARCGGSSSSFASRRRARARQGHCNDGYRTGVRDGSQAQNLLAHAPERLHDEITADYNDMIYAGRRLGRSTVPEGPHTHVAARESSFTFARLAAKPMAQPTCMYLIERLDEEFKVPDRN